MSVVRRDEWPEGLTLYKNVFDRGQSKRIIDGLNKHKWLESKDSDIGFDIQRYGYVFPHQRTFGDFFVPSLSPTPRFLNCFGEALVKTGMFSDTPNQIQVNRYSKGGHSNIYSHSDYHYDDELAILVLGSNMKVSFSNSYDRFYVIVPVGSILVIKDEAWYQYDRYIYENTKLPGHVPRYSIFYRSVREKFVLNSNKNVPNTRFAEVAMYGRQAHMQRLLDLGMDVNISDFSGMTPLMIAAFYGQDGLVEFLLENGANPSIKGPKGKTALDLAKQNTVFEEEQPNYKKIVEMLT